MDERRFASCFPIGMLAFTALMAYAVTLQLRIWHVMAW